ncbi:two pore domain potassium channel family protein [Candidatus Woesearchaeota archaeon]|nr:two pore domain potassium channel family protein [Candidatus Woesearchaeota archaeon]
MVLKLIYPISVIVVLLTIGTVYLHNNESWSYVDSFYFSTITITTVGYGDLVPTKDSSKIFISIYAIFGVSVMLYVLGSIVGRLVVEQEQVFLKLFSSINNLRYNPDLRNKKRFNRELVKNLIKKKLIYNKRKIKW